MCIGLHTLPPCLLFCGNYILHESEYDVHIFCVALDIIIYRLPPLDPVGGYAPATPFLYNQEVYRQSALPREKAHGAVSYLFFLYRLQLVKILLHRAVLHDIIHILCRCRVEIRLEPCYTRTARCKILIRNIIL